jgi:hypothetical protein
MANDKLLLNSRPVAPLGVVPLKSCEGIGKRVDNWLISWRTERDQERTTNEEEPVYENGSYLVEIDNPRFGSGEAKGEIKRTVRGLDLYLMVDITNHSLFYDIYGEPNHMSPGRPLLRPEENYRCSRRKSTSYHRYYAVPVRRQTAQKKRQRVSGLRNRAAGTGQHGRR